MTDQGLQGGAKGQQGDPVFVDPSLTSPPSVELTAGTTHTFTGENFNYDPGTRDGVDIPWATLTITALPTVGTLTFDGTEVMLTSPGGGQDPEFRITRADFDNAAKMLVYTAPTSVPADPAVTFTFTFNDNTRTTQGTFTFNLTAPDFAFTDTSVTAFSLGENIDASGSGDAITIGTVGTANSSGTVTYALDAASVAAGFAIDGTTGAITYAGKGLDHEAAALHTLTVTATDTPQSGNPVMVTHKVVVAVTDVAESPVFTSGATGMTLPENTEVAADAVVYTAAATDDEGAMITYALKAGEGDTDLFEIDGTTGAVTFKAATPIDFETKNSYTFTVIARDGVAGTDDTEQMVTLSVGDVTDATIALNNLTLLMEDDTDTATRIKVADIDLMDDTEGRMDPVTLEVVQDASTAASLTITDSSMPTNPPRLIVTAVEAGAAGNNITITMMEDATLPEDVSATDAYENIAFDITETDSGVDIVVRYAGLGNASLAEIIRAAAADEAVANLVTIAVADGTDAGVVNAFAVAATNLTGGVDMTEPSEMFEIADGALYLKAAVALNAHANPELTVRVQVVEYKHVGAEYTLIVTGDPIAFADAPGVDKAVTLDIDDESGNSDDTTAGGTLEITNAPNGAVTTSNATDAAQYGTFTFDTATGAWTYMLDRADAETAALITNATEGSTIEETLTVTVTPAAGGGPAVTHDIVVTLTVEKTAVVDNAPVIDSAAPAAGAAPIAENTDASGQGNAIMVGTVTATDADQGDTVTYALDAASTALGFVIDSSGVITYTGNGAALDFEAITDTDTNTDGAQHVITVTATGGGKGSATHDVTVTITDVNEPVSIASPALVTAIEEGTSIGTEVVLYTAMAMDDAGDTVMFSLEGLDAGLFDIDATTGAVTFKAATTPDFSMKSAYDFVVVATSSDPVTPGEEARQAVRIPVLQTANAPTVIEEATNASFTLYGVEFIAKGIGASALKFIIEASGNSGADASAITVGQENMTPDENTYTFALKSVVSQSDPTAATISQAALVALWNAEAARKSAVVARIVEPRADVDVGTLLEQYGGETHGFSAAAVPDNYKLILVNAMVSGSPSQHESYGASGILNISDDNGVLLVTHNSDALKWGDFTINAETGVWSYNVPTANIQPLRVLLGDGALPEGETITISAIDSNGIETTYDLVIEFRESGQDEVFEAGSVSIASIAENADGSSSPIAIGTVSAGNVLDSGTIYSLDAASVALGFAIDDGTGAITYTGSGLDHEATPIITLTVTAAGKVVPDGGGSATPHPTRKVTHEVTVFVEDVDEARTFPANVSAIAGEATTINLAELINDPEGATFTFSDVKVNDGSQDGANLPTGIAYANGMLTVATTVTAGPQMLRFKATSSDGNETEHTFTLNVQTAVPVFPDKAKASVTIHGVTFTAVEAGLGGNRFSIKVDDIKFGASTVGTNGSVYTFTLATYENYSPNDLLEYWRDADPNTGDLHPRNEIITAVVTGANPDTGARPSTFKGDGTHALTGGADPSVGGTPTGEKASVTIHGLTFTAADAGTDANAIKIKFDAADSGTTNAIIVENDGFKFTLGTGGGNSAYTPTELLAIWNNDANAPDAMGRLDGIVVTLAPDNAPSGTDITRTTLTTGTTEHTLADGTLTGYTPLAENSEVATRTAIYHGQATDADSGDTITYSLKAGVGDEALFMIDSDDGQVRFKAATTPDYETKASYTFTVIASDGKGGSAEQAVTVSVADLNEAPVIDSDAPTTGKFFENADGIDTPIVVVTGEDNTPLIIAATDQDADDTITYSLDSAAVLAGFAIDAKTGAITYTGAGIDFEDASATKEFTLTVTATDSGSPAQTDTHMVTINVLNVDETPQISGGARVADTVAEGTIANTTVVYTASLVASANDADQTHLWSLKHGEDDDADLFMINDDGEVRFKAATTTVAATTKDTYTFTVVVTDGVNEGQEQVVYLQVADATNGAPPIVFDLPDHTVTDTTARDEVVLAEGDFSDYVLDGDSTALRYVVSMMGGTAGVALTQDQMDATYPFDITDYTHSVAYDNGNFFYSQTSGAWIFHVNEAYLDALAAEETLTFSLQVNDTAEGTADANAPTAKTFTIKLVPAAETETTTYSGSVLAPVTYENSIESYDADVTVPRINKNPPNTDGTNGKLAPGSLTAEDNQAIFLQILSADPDSLSTGIVKRVTLHEVMSQTAATDDAPASITYKTAPHAALTGGEYNLTAADIGKQFVFEHSWHYAGKTYKFITEPTLPVADANDPRFAHDEPLTATIAEDADGTSTAVALKEGDGMVKVAARVTLYEAASASTDVDDPALMIEAKTAGTIGNAITVTIQADNASGVTALASGVKAMVDVTDDTSTTPTTKNIVITYNASETVTLADIVTAVNADTSADDEAADIVTASTNNETAAAFARSKNNLAGGVDEADLVLTATSVTVIPGEPVAPGETFDSGTVVLNTPMYTLDAASVAAGFAIDAMTGAITYTGDGTNLDHEAGETITLTVMATATAPEPGQGQMAVNDPDGVAIRQVVVTIADADDAPAFASDTPATADLPEGADGTETAVTVATVTATDPDDGESVTYTLTAASGANGAVDESAKFAISSAGVITYTGAAIDFEDAAAVKTFTLTITATSSNAASTPAATHTLTVNVVNVDEHAPVFAANSDVTATLAEDADGSGTAMPIGTVTATDADAGSAVTYSLDMASTDAGFAIDSNGALTYEGDGSGLDFEAGAAHVVKVTATGSADTGALTATHNVVVFLTDADEAPVFAANTPTTASIAENADGSSEAIAIATVMATDLDASGGDVTYAITAANDAGTAITGFAIDAETGAITYTGSGLDHEAAEAITLTVTATSPNGGGRDHEIVVSVTDVNEAPVFESLGGKEPTIRIGADGSTNAIDVIAVTAEDPEGDDVQYGLDAASAALGFVIDGTGKITYTGTGIDTAQTITLTVVARDADEYNTLDVDVMVVSSLTSFADGTPTTIDLPEDTDGSSVVAPLETFVATNDGGNTVTYAITAGNGDALFAIDAARGILTYSGGPIDFEGTATKEFTLTITATADGHTVEHMVTIAVSDVNEFTPTATPVNPAAIAEGETQTFTEDNFGFADDDGSGALASVTFTVLPAMGRLVLDGSGPVAANQVIMAADIGKLLYRSGNEFAANTDVTFTYTVSDGQKNSAPATMTIEVTGMDDPATSEVDNDIAFNAGDAFVFTRRQLDSRDPDSPDVPLTYTLTGAITGGGANAVLQTRATSADDWVAVATDGTGTFTQAQVDAGNVRLSGATEGGSFELTAPDGDDETINFLVRVEEEAMGTELGGADLDRSTETAPRTIEAGVGDTTITPGSGDDEIDPGLGDDVVDLTAGGEDIVIYRYATDGDNTIAWGGGDRITGFTPGKDQLRMADVSGQATDFLAGLGDGFIATISTAYDTAANGDRAEIGSYDVTGIEFHFSQAVVLPGGVLGGSILSIEFNDAIDWADFSRDWLNDGAAFNTGSLTFKDDNEGKAALMRILGLDDAGADALRSVAIGDDAVNAIDLTDESGAWVVFGGGGDDGITLGGGTEEVVYRLAVDDSNDITAPDGGDMVTDFTLGTDSLTFVDTDDATVVSRDDLMTAIGAAGGVSLVYNATDSTYTGIVFGVVAADSGATPPVEATALTVSFATALTADALADALGSTIADAAALTTIFVGDAVPTADGNAALNATGIALIDDLFGADNISVDDSLPVELL